MRDSKRSTTRPQVTISGSFNRHWEAVSRVLREVQQMGAEVLSPTHDRVDRDDAGFVYLEGDVGSTGEIETRHLEAIGRSDLLYVVNPDGYVGNSTSLEIGWALSQGIVVRSLEPTDDPVFRHLVPPATLRSAITEARRLRHADGVAPFRALDGLQQYYERAARRRGFADETMVDGYVLFVEEVGELAKAMRGQLGSAVHLESAVSRGVAEELADCLLYIVHLANLAGVSLRQAVTAKEKINDDRTWVRPTTATTEQDAPLKRSE
jgi:NTP pyrophosphatase (non-canonical NTP hydrolase)